MDACIYILYSKKLDKYYVGSTTDLDRRFAEHNRGKEKFTKTGIPWLLVYSEIFEELIQARQERFSLKE